MELPLYIFVKPLIYLVAIVFFYQTVKRKADSRWRFATIIGVLFLISVGLSIYEAAFPVDAVVVLGPSHFSYNAVRALLENVGLFAIVSLLLVLLTIRLRSAKREVELLAQVAVSSADAIVAINADCVINSWNLGAEMVFGYFSEEIVGSPVSKLIAQESLPQLEQAIARCRVDGFVKGFTCTMAARGRNHMVCSVTLSLVLDDDGTAIGTSLFIRDVTEQKRIEEELLQASKMTAMGTMAAGIVHEFGNLLTVISGRAQLGRSAKSLDEARAAFEAVAACSARAKSVTSNLLAYAKRQQPHKAPGQLSQAADAAVELLEKELQHASIAVSRDYRNVPDTLFDPEQITQVFVNLIINALNAMREAGGSISISISEKAEYIKVEVRDTGPGIPPEVMHNLFEPFSTAGGEAHGKPRTGLGLFVCREIVKFHGGSITVESSAEKGTSFRFYIPVTTSSVPANPADTRIVDRGKCHVAVIDRDTMIGDLLAEALRRRGMKTSVFPDAATADAAGAPKIFDLMFIDAAVRDSGGARYIERAKQEGGPFVVAMIGEPVDAEEFRRIEKGALRALRKPFGLDQVNAVCDLIIIPGSGTKASRGENQAA